MTSVRVQFRDALAIEVDNEVIIHSKEKLVPGQFVFVHITKAFDYDLEGEVIP